MALSAGQSIAITGMNGSGKSTLLRIIAGVMTPTSGSVELMANDCVVDEELRPLHIGFVAPYLQLYEGLSLRENLRFVQHVRGRGGSGSDDVISNVVSRVKLDDRADEPVATFSSGMKQRGRLAIALMADAQLLLLDEPSTNLDADGVAIVLDVVKQQIAKGGAVVVATNSDAERDWCTRSICIEDYLSTRK